MRVLYLNHPQENCGVHQFGKNIGNALIQNAQKHKWFYFTVANEWEYWNLWEVIKPEAIIFNFFPSTMPWLSDEVTHRTSEPKIGVLHEYHQVEGQKNKFNYSIYPDPTWQTDDPFVLTTNRLIPDQRNILKLYGDGDLVDPIIGSFGFGFANKEYTHIIQAVENEFDRATIRLHMPAAAFGDSAGDEARQRAIECQGAITKPEIRLEVSHDFIPTTEGMVDWLSENTINLFLYSQRMGQASSAPDYALAANRPLALSDSEMFRHIQTEPSIRLGESSLREIILNGTKPLEPLYKQWTPENIAREYETIIDNYCTSR